MLRPCAPGDFCLGKSHQNCFAPEGFACFAGALAPRLPQRVRIRHVLMPDAHSRNPFRDPSGPGFGCSRGSARLRGENNPNGLTKEALDPVAAARASPPATGVSRVPCSSPRRVVQRPASWASAGAGETRREESAAFGGAFLWDLGAAPSLARPLRRAYARPMLLPATLSCRDKTNSMGSNLDSHRLPKGRRPGRACVQGPRLRVREPDSNKAAGGDTLNL